MEFTLAANELNRVRRNTPDDILREIDHQIARNIRYYAAQPKDVIRTRIADLQREWSVERWLEANTASIGCITSILALIGGRKWGLLTCSVLGFSLVHALQGFDPPLTFLRKLGVRTRGEIDRELYALKALLGEFPGNEPLQPGTSDGRLVSVVRAVSEP
jgi:hypothetical protein